MHEDENKSTFELIGQSPHTWLLSARELKRAADLIAVELRKILSVYPYGRASYYDLALFNPYMLLVGLSIENLAKGILIGRRPEAVSPDKLDSGLKTHDLVHLAKQVNIPYTEDELRLLNRLFRFVLWAGTYPIALSANETISPSFITSDFDDIDKLFDRLVDVLEIENPKPTVGFG